jgi:hypothetical protein
VHARVYVPLRIPNKPFTKVTSVFSLRDALIRGYMKDHDGIDV